MKERRPRDTWDWLRDALEARGFRIALAVLIVISLLPYEALETRLRGFFLMVFGTELVLRVGLLIKGRVAQRRSEWFFVLIDMVALASFLPLDAVFGVPRSILRTLRLARLFALLRFTRELARDVYRVLTRREQLQQLGLVTIAVLALSFVTAVVLHTFGAEHDFDGSGGQGFWDQVWWAFRQVESPDNLIQSLDTEPLLAFASLGLTIMGIFVFSYLIGLGTNIVEQVLRAERRRPVAYRNHTLVTGPIHDAELLVREFVEIYQKNRSLRRIRPREVWAWLVRGDPRPRRHALPKMTLLGASAEPPNFLYEARMRWVVFRQGDAANPEALDLVAAEDAKRAVLLTEPSEVGADGQTIARLASFRGRNPDAHVFLEIAESHNAALARDVGGPGTFVLDVPRFVGLFLCHHLIIPGVDRLFAELMSARGNEMYTHLFEDGRAPAGCDGELDFAQLARMAHEEFGVSLVGVFLGTDEVGEDRRGLLPVDRYHPWVNPYDTRSEGLERFALTPGKVPAEHLRGIFGVAETYLPVRRCARDLSVGVMFDTQEITDDPLAQKLFEAPRAQRAPQSVMIVGENGGLRPMIDALMHFVPGVDIRIVVGREGSDVPSDAEEFEGGGRCRTLRCPRRGSRTSAEVAAADVADEPAEAAVFLSNFDDADPDAETALRVLRFVRAAPKDARMRLLIEVDALHRGEPIERNVRGLCGDRFEVTFVSTGQISNFFMVHGAFVPGVMALYERLLGTRGDELVYFPTAATEGVVAYRALRDALARQRCVLLGVDLVGGLVLNASADRLVPLAELRGVFAVADAHHGRPQNDSE